MSGANATVEILNFIMLNKNFTFEYHNNYSLVNLQEAASSDAERPQLIMELTTSEMAFMQIYQIINVAIRGHP
jgi:hypothetical protein